MDQWEQIVKVDSNARYMRFKVWPMFDEWKDIFGKDQATCSTRRDLLELNHDVHSNINVGNENQESQFEASDDARSRINPDNNMSSPEMSDQSTGNSQDETNAKLDKLAGRIGKLDTVEFILSIVEHLGLFMCLSEAFHHAYVLRALEKNH
ncbi:hypothetical protein AAHA92_02995 [Salvia divinorum]|uniref:Uncharacterized protein n=1 Tax=Salvia divinorum TaxID=28513 RepID=A0ABD1IIB4_SALDI